jgi:hypothetical protein
MLQVGLPPVGSDSSKSLAAASASGSGGMAWTACPGATGSTQAPGGWAAWASPTTGNLSVGQRLPVLGVTTA